MRTSKQEIGEWFDEGVAKKATHMIVVCDTFDHEDYPVYVTDKENILTKIAEYSGPNMQRVMEVYKMADDKDKQLNSPRCHNI